MHKWPKIVVFLLYYSICNTSETLLIKSKCWKFSYSEVLRAEFRFTKLNRFLFVDLFWIY